MKDGKGAIKDRDQVYNSKTGRWVKRDENGKFMSVKFDDKPYKSVRKK
ncbi:MAG: hypothetical protein RBR05_02460 [Candidatus Methanomethylophilaceae archaeon]|jgi:hypothetical protein|nr:hypothetical protein [Candidatus Methanomethylophilaceae archaeon]MDD3068236.1 hypothetical protein [Acholeplasmataceae bacterium]MDY0224248.1 hypothetical protein [Candidatus Methanomethylophilaceae archaeon]MDY3202094.1 hypothetical protein [Methanocorpusculum sp.]